MAEDREVVAVVADGGGEGAAPLAPAPEEAHPRNRRRAAVAVDHGDAGHVRGQGEAARGFELLLMPLESSQDIGSTENPLLGRLLNRRPVRAGYQGPQGSPRATLFQ